MPSALSDSIRGLMDAVAEIERDAPARAALEDIVARGEFRPDEDEMIGYWLARFLTIRAALWDVILDVLDVLDDPSAANDTRELRYFVIGYSALCLLIRIDRVFLFDVACHSLIQRKLNEPFPEYRIPRKQYTTIFEAFVDERDALAVLRAMRWARKKRRKILKLADDPEVGFLVTQLRDLEKSLIPSKRRYLKDLWMFVSHKWRRRGVVSARNILATIMEGFGRTASEFCPRDNKRVSAEIRHEIGTFLKPGDVLVTRHAKALTNLFLPGFWPHAALYVGTKEQRAAISCRASHEKLEMDGICVLEALKDGARLRPVTETLAVDSFVVLRPRLNAESIARAIERAVAHEGKMYNFDFDFFNSDRIVCTEVIYRAYDGLEELRFPLQERAGRKTLSAEDLLDYALDAGMFEPVAIFGVDGCLQAIVFGDDVPGLLIRSYRENRSQVA